MLRYKLILLSLLLLLNVSCYSGNKNSDLSSAKPKSLVIAFYNVENLFDTHDDANVDDAEFTPDGKSLWNNAKYEKKISNIARVIKAMNNDKGADIIGLSEVENKGVLEHLIADPQLKKLGYKIMHHDSPDGRGIDVAMIYKKNAMKVLDWKALPVDISLYGERPTRDVLWITGLVGSDTIYFFLNHWPSRREGKETSEPKRIVVANVVRKVVDPIMAIHPQAKILIMGDFNDNPTDKSVYEILKGRKSPELNYNSFYNCDFNFDWKKGEGSEFYRGDWSRLIQIIVSTSLIKNQITSSGTFSNAYIFKQDWMLKKDDATQQMIPERTFEDDGVIGFSDHLPVYIILKLSD